MTLFDLAAKIGLDSSEFEEGVDNAERSGKSLREKLTSSFDKIKKAAAVALSGATIKKGIDMLMDLANATSAVGDKIDKQSQVLGLSRKAYQEWDYILGQNGASIDSLGTSMRTLNDLVLDAADGGEESKNAFAKLGVSIHELENLGMEDQFEAVVRAFQRMPEGAKKSALAVQIFGHSGMDLLPLLNQSETSIDELRQRAEELGIVMGDDAINASVAYNDAMDDLNRTVNGLKYSFGAKLLPTLTSGINKVASYVGKLSNAFQENGIKGVWEAIVADFQNVEWPDVSTILTSFSNWWENTAKPAIQGAAKWTLQLFGVPEETAEGVSKLISGWWDNVKNAAEGVINWALNMPDSPHDSGTQLHDIIQGWWDGVKEHAQGILKWVLGIPDMGDADGSSTTEVIKKWWNESVVPFLKNAINFELGLFGLPSIEEMANAIRTWWEDVKKNVGKLFMNVFFGYDTDNTGGDTHSANGAVYGGGGRHFDGSNAKGMWYVPYDGFRAELHRGETVLNASRARDYRDGNSGEFNMSAMMSMMADTIRSSMEGITVKSYLSGKDVTDDVNRNTIRQLKARRFAT